VPERLLDAVRLFDPEATLVDGGITFGAGVRLAGPEAVTPNLARKTGLPQGHVWVVSDEGPFPTWLVRGLARRFGGYAHVPRQVIADEPGEVAVVHTARPARTDELGRWLPGLVAGAPEADGSYFLSSPLSPVRVRCDGPEVASLRWLLPPALGPLRQEPGLHGYRFLAETADAVRPAATAAWGLAQVTGGVVTDRDRFRVASVDELHALWP
jgi:hypothetical protein